MRLTDHFRLPALALAAGLLLTGCQSLNGMFKQSKVWDPKQGVVTMGVMSAPNVSYAFTFQRVTDADKLATECRTEVFLREDVVR